MLGSKMIKQKKLRKGAIQLIVFAFIFMMYFLSIQNGAQISPIQCDEEFIKQDENDTYEKIGSYADDYGEVVDIYVREGIAYIVTNFEFSYESTMLIVNVTDKSSPTFISKLPILRGSTSSIWVDGNYAVIGILNIPHYTCLVDISNL